MQTKLWSKANGDAQVDEIHRRHECSANNNADVALKRLVVEALRSAVTYHIWQLI